MGKRYKAADWAEAKKRCRLNQADIQMAKELGMTPKILTKNIPSKNQQWKAPVKIWVRDLYEEKFGTIIEGNAGPSQKGKNSRKQPSQSRKTDTIQWDDLPF